MFLILLVDLLHETVVILHNAHGCNAVLFLLEPDPTEKGKRSEINTLNLTILKKTLFLKPFSFHNCNI